LGLQLNHVIGQQPNDKFITAFVIQDDVMQTERQMTIRVRGCLPGGLLRANTHFAQIRGQDSAPALERDKN
jgi:hypothetical protein